MSSGLAGRYSTTGRGQLRAGAVQHGRHPLEKHRRVAVLALEERNGRNSERGDGADHRHDQQGDDEPVSARAGQVALEARRERLHQGVHEEPGEQRRRQMPHQDGDEAEPREDVARERYTGGGARWGASVVKRRRIIELRDAGRNVRDESSSRL